jgi:RNA polymerase sigma factor (sigma-70 family)
MMPADGEVEACVRAEYGRLVGVVAVVTGSRAQAEDAVQEAFAKAWERARKGQHFDHLAGWVVTVALNHARSGRRREGSEKRAVERLGARVASESDADDAMVVRAALSTLARRQRDCVVLYYFLDLDVATVAKVLDISQGTVKSALARARNKLAVLLGKRALEA